MTIPPPTGPVDPDRPEQLPTDLQPDLVGPYRFPDVARRRLGAAACAVVGVACIVFFLVWRSSVRVNSGLVVGGAVLLLLAAWQWWASWHLAISDLDALTRAGAALGFPIGHAAAGLSWRGVRSRPVWRVLVYSAEDPPLQRGIVEVDGVDGTILFSYSEDNPEDWSVPGV